VSTPRGRSFAPKPKKPSVKTICPKNIAHAERTLDPIPSARSHPLGGGRQGKRPGERRLTNDKPIA
jgi:hypothetical protein